MLATPRLSISATVAMWFIRFSYLFGGDHSLWSSYWNLLRFIDQAASPNPPHLPRLSISATVAMWFIRFSYLFGGDHSLWSSYWNLLRFIDQAASPNPPHLPRIRNRGAEGYSRRGERHIIAV